MTNIFLCPRHQLKLPRITKGEGIRLYDGNGKSYIDIESGIWCKALGHNHP